MPKPFRDLVRHMQHAGVIARHEQNERRRCFPVRVVALRSGAIHAIFAPEHLAVENAPAKRRLGQPQLLLLRTIRQYLRQIVLDAGRNCFDQVHFPGHPFVDTEKSTDLLEIFSLHPVRHPCRRQFLHVTSALISSATSIDGTFSCRTILIGPSEHSGDRTSFDAILFQAVLLVLLAAAAWAGRLLQEISYQATSDHSMSFFVTSPG